LGGQTEIVAPEDAKGQQTDQISDSAEQGAPEIVAEGGSLSGYARFLGIFWFFE
jgi:hypothetical protein